MGKFDKPEKITEKDIIVKLTLDEYHDLLNLSKFLDPESVEKLGHELTDLLNKYTNMIGIDKIKLVKNISLNLISTGVDNYLKYTKKKELNDFQEEYKWVN